MKIRKTI